MKSIQVNFKYENIRQEFFAWQGKGITVGWSSRPTYNFIISLFKYENVDLVPRVERKSLENLSSSFTHMSCHTLSTPFNKEEESFSNILSSAHFLEFLLRVPATSSQCLTDGCHERTCLCLCEKFHKFPPFFFSVWWNDEMKLRMDLWNLRFFKI